MIARNIKIAITVAVENAAYRGVYLRTFGYLQVYNQFSFNLNNLGREVKRGRQFLRIVQVGYQRIENTVYFVFVNPFNSALDRCI